MATCVPMCLHTNMHKYILLLIYLFALHFEHIRYHMGQNWVTVVQPLTWIYPISWMEISQCHMRRQKNILPKIHHKSESLFFIWFIQFIYNFACNWCFMWILFQVGSICCRVDPGFNDRIRCSLWRQYQHAGTIISLSILDNIKMWIVEHNLWSSHKKSSIKFVFCHTQKILAPSIACHFNIKYQNALALQFSCV